jgi:hypothetical protein
MNISATVLAALTITETLADGLVSGTLAGGIDLKADFTPGTGARQADLHWETPAAVTLAAGASITYTLSALVDGLNRTVAFARVRGFGVDNSGTTTDGYNLLVASGATNGWKATFGGVAGQFLVFAAGVEVKLAPLATGMVVTAGTSDQLTITNQGAGPATFTMALIGSST